MGPNPRPQLPIKGCWLEAFGFTTGQPVIIDAQHGLFIIRIEGLELRGKTISSRVKAGIAIQQARILYLTVIDI
ncbi:SymE family type I addiction module toxin [Snodgrassella alvi]|uniref:SymE family type I addiction module toxin n=1 Tax=Snodgrassella alvi TaxID=1196083 RepID=UPI00351B16A2